LRALAHDRQHFARHGWVAADALGGLLEPAWTAVDDGLLDIVRQDGADTDRSLEALSLPLFDLARGPLMAWVESLLQHRVVPLRVRLHPAAREPDEGTLLQEQATYEAHFPAGTWAASVFVPTGPVTFRLHGPCPSATLPHRTVSGRVRGAQLETTGVGQLRPSAVTTDAPVCVSALVPREVPVADSPVLSFDYRTSTYRQSLDPVTTAEAAARG